MMTINDKIRNWVYSEFSSKYADLDQIVKDLRDVAAGNRIGSQFECNAIRWILNAK